jgi:hypothetical protein
MTRGEPKQHGDENVPDALLREEGSASTAAAAATRADAEFSTAPLQDVLERATVHPLEDDAQVIALNEAVNVTHHVG